MKHTCYKIEYTDAYGNKDAFQCGGVVGKTTEAIKCFNDNIKFATILRVFRLNDSGNGWMLVEETV
jgi:hypothetical protein